MTSIRRIVTLLSLSVLLIFPTHFVTAQSAVTRAVEKPYIVEWVYRVKWGPQEEWLDIFRKYQVAILDKQKQLGYVKDYTISAPSLHTSEYARWDHRVKVMNDFDYPQSTTGKWHELKPLDSPFPDQLTTLQLVRDGLNGDAYFIDTITGHI